MRRLTCALFAVIIGCASAMAQTFEDVDLSTTPFIQTLLNNPEKLYPSGGVVSSDQLGVYAAYYETLTDRYGHNIFAGNSEYTVLGVKIDGKTYKLTLQNDVFEDSYPRIADLDGDGIGEIITIQSSLTKGASIAVYALRGGALNKIAQTPYIGTRNRWMNIAGIADFNGDGLMEIALVDRPHIRGELEFWTFTRDGDFELRASALGFSNHFIGSNAQQLSAVVKIGDRTLLALPSTDRKSLHLVDASGDTIKIIAKADLPAKIVDNFAPPSNDKSNLIGLLLEGGAQKVFRIAP